MLEFTVEKYYLVKLLKIQSNHNNVRTTEIVGYAPHLPTISVPSYYSVKVFLQKIPYA